MVRGKRFSKVGGTINPQTDSPLMLLPGEIRNIIYEYVFAGSICRVYNRKSPDFKLSAAPALLVSCKQSYFEALGFYYSTANFVFDYRCKTRLKKYLSKIGRARASMLRNVNIEDWLAFIPTIVNPKSLLHAASLQDKYLQSLVPVFPALAQGTLKLSVDFEQGRVWTSTPSETAREFLDVTEWMRNVGRVWVKEPSRELKALLPPLMKK